MNKFFSMSEAGNAPRKWWISAVFSYLVPGLGQCYNGQLVKGILITALFSAWGVFMSNASLTLLNMDYQRHHIFIFLGFLAVTGTFFIWLIIDAITGSRKRKQYELKNFNRWYIYVLAIILFQGLDFFTSRTVKELLIQPYRIPTNSMAPAVVPGDFLLCNKLAYASKQPARGDVIMFYHTSGNVYIKRIIGLPSDTLEIIKKNVYINHSLLEEKWKNIDETTLIPAQRSTRDYLAPIIIGADEYFVMGDNRDLSSDSRFWGTVPREKIIGKPSFIYWSWQEMFPYIKLNRIGKSI